MSLKAIIIMDSDSRQREHYERVLLASGYDQVIFLFDNVLDEIERYNEDTREANRLFSEGQGCVGSINCLPTLFVAEDDPETREILRATFPNRVYSLRRV